MIQIFFMRKIKVMCITFFSTTVFGMDFSSLDNVLEWGTISLRITRNQIRELDLSGKNIDSTGAAVLSLVLRTNDSLTSINLANNQIRNEGLEHIIDALANHRKIKNLNFSNNKIDNDGFSILANLDRNGYSLMNLNMSRNLLTVRALIECPSFLVNNTKLRTLNLSNNQIGDITWLDTGIVSTFALALYTMKNNNEDPNFLQTLSLSQNNLSTSAKLALTSSGVNIRF